jgi:hypothetical protein
LENRMVAFKAFDTLTVWVTVTEELVFRSFVETESQGRGFSDLTT